MAEKKVIEIDIESNLGSLKSQLREAQAEVAELANKFGATSDEAVKAAKKAAELKDAIGDAKALTDAYNPDAKFNALSTSIGGVLNGFQAYEGAMGLIGVESESLQKTLLKVQSAMALTQGINGILEAKESFLNLGKQVSTFGSSAVGAFQKMTTASKAFLVTGIGLLIAGVGLAIANFDKLKSVMSNQTATQKILNEVMLKSSDAIKNEVNASNKLSKELKDENLTREEKIQKVKQFQKDYPGLISNMTLEKGNLSDINNELVTNIKLLKLQSEQKAIEELRAEKLQEKLRIQLDLQNEAQKKAGEFTLDLGSSAKNGFIGFSSGAENARLATIEVTKVVTDGTKAIDKQIKSLDNASKQTEKSIDKITKAGAKSKEEVTKQDEEADKKAQEIEDKRKARIEEANQLRKAQLEQIKEYYKTAKDENEARLRTEQEQEEFLINDKYKSQIALFKKYGKDTTELEIAQLNEINEIRLKYQQKDYDAKEASRQLEIQAIKDANQKRIELEDKQFEVMQSIGQTAKEKEIADLVKSYEDKFAIAGDNIELEKELTAQQKIDLGIIEDKYRKEQEEKDKESKEKQIANENNLRQSRLKMTADAFSAIGDLVGSFNTKNDKDARKQFQIQKAFNLGAAITNTAMAVTGALTAGGNPIKLATGAQFVEAGIAATVGLANVAKIASTKFGGNGGGGGGGGGGDVPTSGFNPSFNVVGNSGINQLAGIQQQPVKAYITTGEVSTALSLERNTLQKTTF